MKDQDEALAKKIKRLLFSASFHASGDPRAFKHLSGQLQEIGNSIASSGPERWYLVKMKVISLCGEHFVGLSQYYDLLGGEPEASVVLPESVPIPNQADPVGIGDASPDPTEIASRLGLQFVQIFEGVVYARDKSTLYSIGPLSQPGPRVPEKVRADNGYVGEEYHSPREAALSVGWTIIEGDVGSSGSIYALDGFGRKFLVNGTGNGPQADLVGFGSDAEIRRWAPKHRPRRRTVT